MGGLIEDMFVLEVGRAEMSTKTSQSAGSGNRSAVLLVVIATLLSALYTVLPWFSPSG